MPTYHAEMPRQQRPPPQAKAPPRLSPRELDAVNRELARAVDLHKQGQSQQAAQCCARVLQRAPNHADALQLLGTLEGQAGRSEQALALLRRAVAVSPDHARAHNNLGMVLTRLERHEEALASFERAASLMPANARAWANCGRSLRVLGRLEEALASFDRLLALEPESAEGLANRADLLERLCRRDLKWRGQAIEAARRAHQQAANPEMYRFVLAAIGGEPAPTASPRHFVSDLFDNYADNFDAHLVGGLKYRTPELIEAAVLRAGVPPSGRVLDLGCGTGLCGPFLKPWAAHLTGVDLSQRMLDKAAERGLYDELVCSDLVEHLRSVDVPAHLVVAADVFVYIGDLAPVFAEVRRCLHADGLFAFSVEAHEGADYELMPSRRYAHSVAYLHRLAAEHGFGSPSIESGVLREQAGQPVQGYLAVMRAAPTAPM